MKKATYIFVLLMVFTQSETIGQCFLDRHDTSPQNAWESCSTSASPNPARPAGHWIMYDLGQPYPLGQLHIWNYNFPGETNKGVSNIIIDYTNNLSSWSGGLNFVVAEANGSAFYEGEPGPQLNGAIARYVLITATNNHGGACTGLAEIKIGIYQNPCNELVIQIDDAPITNGEYHAENEILSEGLVNATSDVFFKAEDEITLEPGFQTKLGADFDAVIVDCPN